MVVILMSSRQIKLAAVESFLWADLALVLLAWISMGLVNLSDLNRQPADYESDALTY